ncbi:MAG: exodeoxyribonuclease VII small subunit [Peptoniphilaceae bacterium]|nr:exodeoxyribonuclease VII small subunit [Peptoniphilaceae bacterium]MCI6659302.1 exodeoxyribonuclease VII small subunit [Peptoniphilaceae bacterium]MDD7434756.1 exodeoxyribonuclease VII small subunit [Peptoniphilaceae bacterium]MDY3075769.1 exodeoxyribonuclease VII small subunit [Peptoniphilaceae bacterium]MDY3987622.1 exodeoxyribonuclease VII small subunit [Peptoniphilaceae bacterium]
MEDLKFEEGLQRLNKIASSMKNEETSLDDMITLYKEAKELSDQLHKDLDEAELTVRRIDDGETVPITLDQENPT